MVANVMLGTCRELSVGPAALISLMTAQAIQEVSPAAVEGSTVWVAMAVLLAFLVGAVPLGLGLARMGVLVNFLSRPVVNGFMSAAALIIGASQFGLILGVSLPHGTFFEVLSAAVGSIPAAHPLTVALGLGCAGIPAVSRAAIPKVPMPFLLVVSTTGLAWALGLDADGLAVVGAVEGGLPTPALPSLLTVEMVLTLMPYAPTIAMVGFMESISVAKAYGFQHRYDVDANTELRALGVGNLLGGVFGAFVATGNISRTVVAAQAGVRTQLGALITALVVLLTVVWLAPLFEFLPKATLAAMIIVAVAGIIDLREPLRIGRFKKADAAALALTFSATLLFGVEVGILTGITASLVLHVYQTTTPHIAVLGRIPGTHHYRSAERFPEAELDDGIVVLRVDEALYFANAPTFRDAVEHAHNVPAEVPRALVLDCTAINDLDVTALAVLQQVADELHDAGTQFALAGVSGPIHDILAQSGVLEHIGEEHLHLGVHEAVESFRDPEALRPLPHVDHPHGEPPGLPRHPMV
jgi:SulP family sulfate permease